MELTSISIGQRVEKSPENEFGWCAVEVIPKDEVCVLILGGNGTNSDKRANGYAKSYKNLLKQAGITDASVYAVIYHNQKDEEIQSFAFFMQQESRKAFLEKHGRNKIRESAQHEEEMKKKIEKLKGKEILNRKSKDIQDPSYIKDLFYKAIFPRISDNGQRISEDEAVKRIGRLNIVAHCHGAYLFVKLEEMMQQKMAELGYTDKERQNIQKQLLCVAHSPYCPLGVSKSTMISFGSASDDEVWHQNDFHKGLKELNKDGKLKLSYFPEKKGEVFVASKIMLSNSNFDERTQSLIEHGFVDMTNPKYELSKEGKALMLLERNAIVNGVKRSLNNESISNTKELVCGQDGANAKFFNVLLENGQKAYQEILQHTKQQAYLSHTKIRE